MSIRSQTCDNEAIPRPAAFDSASLGPHSDGKSSLAGQQQDAVNADDRDPMSIVSEHFTRKDEKHRDEMAALRDKVRELEEETPEQRSNRLSVEKNTKIDRLKSEVEKINKQDESLQAENKELEKKLKTLEADIKKLQPPAEFTVKEKKTKGKKK
ncbi:hypothetical protein J4E81_006567 [Alternaria sp. BMP 2799]|nr:hypothetical protein J4E81_006567 [Alternaria sp. BMP 2799]